MQFSRNRLAVEVLESRDVPSSFALGPLVQVSGPSPFNGNPNQPAYARNAETENFVAVDPTNPNHAVAAWFQDLVAGIVSATTFDGGATWQSSVVPGLTLCSGGTYPVGADPWVTFAANGDVYVSSVQNHFFDPSQRGNAIRVNKSSDGGLTWDAPVSLIEEDNAGKLNDKVSITADPTNPSTVYAVWRQNAGADRERNPRSTTMFSRTTDGGVTWEPARALAVAGNDDQFHAHQVLVRPDGTLVILAELDVRHGQSITPFLSISRSTDGGATWSTPLRGPQMFAPDGALDPETGQGIDNGNPDFAVDPGNGRLYAVWNDTRFLGEPYASTAFSMSADGGLTWSAPIRINQTPTTIATANQQTFLPSIAVADDGIVGVTYYDLRNNTPAAGLPTDYWFIHGDPGSDLTNPANWGQELRLTNTSFDMEQGPNQDVKGFFVGDYEGLAAAGNDFVPTWSMPHGTDLASLFSRRIIAGAPLEAVSVGHNPVSQALTTQQVAALLPEAIQRWQAIGLDTSVLVGLDVRIADLGGTTLGLVAGNTIYLDVNAAGWGWFVDPTPHDDREFTTSGNQGEQGKMDLLTVLEHEVGHLLGFDHTAQDLMNATLAPGIRETPTAMLDAYFASL